MSSCVWLNSLQNSRMFWSVSGTSPAGLSSVVNRRARFMKGLSHRVSWKMALAPGLRTRKSSDPARRYLTTWWRTPKPTARSKKSSSYPEFSRHPSVQIERKVHIERPLHSPSSLLHKKGRNPAPGPRKGLDTSQASHTRTRSQGREGHERLRLRPGFPFGRSAHQLQPPSQNGVSSSRSNPCRNSSTFSG